MYFLEFKDDFGIEYKLEFIPFTDNGFISLPMPETLVISKFQYN